MPEVPVSGVMKCADVAITGTSALWSGASQGADRACVQHTPLYTALVVYTSTGR